MNNNQSKPTTAQERRAAFFQSLSSTSEESIDERPELNSKGFDQDSIQPLSKRSFEVNHVWNRTVEHKVSLDSSLHRPPRAIVNHQNTLQDFRGIEPDSVSFNCVPRRRVPLIPVPKSEVYGRGRLNSAATVPTFFERRRSTGDTASVSFFECISPEHPALEEEVDMPSAACQHNQPQTNMVQKAIPNRISKKAVLTVDFGTSKILTANDMACSLMALSHEKLLGRKLSDLTSGMDYCGPKFLDDSFVTENGELLPVYGKVIDVLDNDGEKFPVSLWIYPLGCAPCDRKSHSHHHKENRLSMSLPASSMKGAKRAASEDADYMADKPCRCLAVLEPVQRISVQCVLGPKGRIFSADPKMAEVFGYTSSTELLGGKVQDMIPCLSLEQTTTHEDHLAGKTKMATFFPLTVITLPTLDEETQDVLKYELTVHVFTTISGVVTVRTNGKMHSCNAYFASALFGCLQEQLVGESITTIIPDFYVNMHDEKHEHARSATDALLDRMNELDLSSSSCVAVPSTSQGVTPVASDAELVALVTPVKNGEATRVTGLFTPLSDETVKKMGNLQSCNGAIPINTSTPANENKTVNKKIKEGCFWGFGKHRDGSKVAIGYQIRHLVLRDGEELFCIWIFRDPNMQKKPDDDGRSNVTLEPEGSVLVCGDYAQKYDTMQQVGKGAFGYVRLGARKKDGLLVITKFVNKGKVLADCWIYDERWLKEVPIEISILTSVRHPNIVKVLDVFQNDLYYQVVMEKHGAGMDLFEFIERRPDMDEPLLSYLYRQIVSAVHYLNSIKIVHRDIKDENVIIDEKFHCKLIDFGSAARFEEGKLFSTFCGTMEYCSPEVLMGNKYAGPELEMWSMGVLLYTLVYSESPFARPEDTVRCELELPFDVTEGLASLISWMLYPNPEYRASISDIAQHWWLHQKVNINDYKFDKVLNHVEPHETTPLKYLKQIDPTLDVATIVTDAPT